MEFGIHERLPIYSGGLGVLAGDHLKAAAELGVPLVGVGLLYTGGYFRQGIDKSGRQTEDYQPVDPEAVGLVREDVSVTVELAGETIEAAVWRKDVAVGSRRRPALPARGRLAHRRALRRRPRAPDPPGASARRRRRPRARGARDRAERLPPERGAFGVPPARASARARRRRRRDRRRARVDSALLRLHDAHARAGGQRGLRRGARRFATSATSPPRAASSVSACSSSGAPATSPASA